VRRSLLLVLLSGTLVRRSVLRVVNGWGGILMATWVFEAISVAKLLFLICKWQLGIFKRYFGVEAHFGVFNRYFGATKCTFGDMKRHFIATKCTWRCEGLVRYSDGDLGI